MPPVQLGDNQGAGNGFLEVPTLPTCAGESTNFLFMKGQSRRSFRVEGPLVRTWCDSGGISHHLLGRQHLFLGQKVTRQTGEEGQLCLGLLGELSRGAERQEGLLPYFTIGLQDSTVHSCIY